MILKKNIQIYIIGLLILLFVFVFGVSSNVLAYSYNNFIDFANQCLDDPVVNNDAPYNLEWRASLVSVFHDTIANILTQHGDSPNNYDAFVSLNDVDGYNSVIFLSNNNYEYELNTIVSGYNRVFYITGNMTIVCFKNNTWYYFTGSLSRYTNNGVVGLLTKDARYHNDAMFSTQYNKKAFYLQNNYVSSVVAFETAPLDETLQNGKEVVRLQYRMNDLYLGHFINLIDNSITDVEYTISFNNGTWAEHGYYNLNSKTNGNDYLYSSGDSVYIKPILLNYYNTYEFNWGAWSDEDLIEQGTLYYYVLPLNAVVSGGVITDYGSGEEYSTQDSTIDLIGSLTQFNNVTSGDIVSNINVNPSYTNPQLYNFFYDFLQHISDVFLLDDEVTLSLNLPIYNRQINIRSDFWITKNYLGNQFYDFIQGAWWVLICTLIVYKVDLLVELFNFGDFIGAMGEIYQTRRLL